MRLLAIETATRNLGCALWQDGAPVARFSLVAGQRHSEVLMPAIDQLCRTARWAVADIEAVAVDHGPGLFTGLRVGLATARALAAGRGLPAVGVSSLEVLAYPWRRCRGLLASVVDAKRGEVFWAIYRADGTRLEQVRGPAVGTPAALAGELSRWAGDGRPLALGDGAWRYRAELSEVGAEVVPPEEIWPSVDALGALGHEKLSEGAPTSLPMPLYLRQADVRIGWETLRGRAGAGELAGPAGQGARLAP